MRITTFSKKDETTLAGNLATLSFVKSKDSIEVN